MAMLAGFFLKQKMFRNPVTSKMSSNFSSLFHPLGLVHGICSVQQHNLCGLYAQTFTGQSER